MPVFKSYFTICCYAFTFIVLIYSVLVKADLFTPMSVNDIFIYFLMSICLTAVIAAVDLLPIRSYRLASLVRIIGIAVVVFGTGFAFHLFPLEWTFIGSILGMILVIYFAVSALLMVKDQKDASAINEQLSQRRQNRKDTGGERHE